MVRSGLDVLQELLEQVIILNKRFEVTEQNVKELLNRFNTKEQDKPKILANNIPPLKTIQEQLATLPNANETARVTGKVKTPEGKIVIGVEVQVYNEENKMIKRTKTNKAGDWMCFLPVGKYTAKYILKNIIDTKVDFVIRPDQKIIKVSQPT